MHEIIMGYQGEMSLKGLNRNQFESAMMKILRYRLKTVGKFKVYCTQSTFYMGHICYDNFYTATESFHGI